MATHIRLVIKQKLEELTSTQPMTLKFVEVESDGSSEEEHGFKEFLRNPAMSGDATDDEIEFLGRAKFRDNRPNALCYYRELQSLRDPLHFSRQFDCLYA